MTDQPHVPVPPFEPQPAAGQPGPASAPPAAADPTAVLPTAAAQPSQPPPDGYPQAPDGYPVPPGAYPPPSAYQATPGVYPPPSAYPATPGAYPQAPGPYPAYPGPVEPHMAYMPPGGFPGQPVPGAKTNGFAIASLVFGILGGVLFGFIFGAVALVQIRKRGQAGRGIAIAGLIASAVWTTLILLVVAAEISTGGSGSNGTGGDGTVSITTLKPGDCLSKVTASGTVTDVPVVSCSVPHEGEVFAVFDLPDGAWPGEAAVEKQSESRCNAEFTKYAKAPDNKLDLYYLHPKQESWWRDRGVTCIASDPSGPRTGSLRN